MESNHATGRDAHGHILLVYEDHDERLRLLAEYFGEGLANNELCVLVTPGPLDRVINDLRSAGLDAQQAANDDRLRIFEMTDTYLPHGKFIANYMLQNVTDYIAEARNKGFSGVRTAGEMSWLYGLPEFFEAADQYERMVTELGSNNPQLTGLCLYPVRQGSGRILDDALHTHQSIIYDGTLRTNPFSNGGQTVTA